MSHDPRMFPASLSQSRHPDFCGRAAYITPAYAVWWLVHPGERPPVVLDPLLRRSTWSIGPLARLLGIGTRTLARIIERSTGLSAKTWLRQTRAVTACNLLREGWKIEALSIELGFRHTASFTREFKSVVGVSPSIYFRSEKSRFFSPPGNRSVDY